MLLSAFYITERTGQKYTETNHLGPGLEPSIPRYMLMEKNYQTFNSLPVFSRSAFEDGYVNSTNKQHSSLPLRKIFYYMSRVFCQVEE